MWNRASNRDQQLRPGQPLLFESVSHRRVYVELVVRDHPGQHRSNGDVEDRAENKRNDDPYRHVALRVARFFRMS